MTSEASPSSQKESMSINDLYLLFKSSKNVYFATINPNKGYSNKRVTSVSKWADHIRKRSEHFFIVREREGCFHFHAIFQTVDDSPIPRGYYVKGIHMNIQKVEDTRNHYRSFNSSEDLMDQAITLADAIDKGVPTVIQSIYEELVEEARATNKSIREWNKVRPMNSFEIQIFDILKYMIKENPVIQYEDYILVSKNRNITAPMEVTNV